MRAAVVHGTMNACGGGELLALAVIESLQELGFEVDLVVMEPTEWGRVWGILGRRVKPDRELPLFPFRVKAFGIYARMLSYLRIARKRERYDLIVNTHGDLTPMAADIVYMHFPTFAVIHESPEDAKYVRSPFWRVYFEPFRLAQRRLLKRLREARPVLLTNSTFSRMAIRRHVGMDALVVYPPVDLEAFSRHAGGRGRDPVVYTTGRYTPEKNYELILEVARLLPDVEFHVSGSLSSKAARPYLERLERLRERLGARNVHFHVDVPRGELARMYGRGMVYMHTMIKEHFGLAVVEGMAAGLVPVVHRSGGPWLDIIERGRYGLAYETPEEAAEAIERAIRHYKHYSRLAMHRAQQFTWNTFKQKFQEIVVTRVRETILYGCTARYNARYRTTHTTMLQLGIGGTVAGSTQEYM